MVFDLENPSEDFRYLESGSINLFLKSSVLDDAIRQFRSIGYTVNEIKSETVATIYQSLGEAYDWQSLFGYAQPNNLNALIDGVTDGNGPMRALVFRNFDQFHASEPEKGHAFMDVLETCARRILLFGQRLVVFVQVSDPRFEMCNLGARAARWNPAEWMNKDRGL